MADELEDFDLSDPDLRELMDWVEDDLPDHDPAPARSDSWVPNLAPSQYRYWVDPARVSLVYGPKGTGKGIVALHKLVRHSFEAKRGLGLIIVHGYNVGQYGIWDDLNEMVLPAWRDGNKAPEWIMQNGVQVPNPLADTYLDNGIGLEFTASQQDAKTKIYRVRVGNMHGKWSTILLLSIPHSAVIESRMKGLQPSFTILEEATDHDSEEFFRYPMAQMGRRSRQGNTPQHFVMVCNPTGPSHWVYKLKERLKDDPEFTIHFIPLEENIINLSPGYENNLRMAFGDDPVLWARLRKGEWVDRPAGDAIFKDHFIEAQHVIGDELLGTGIMPARAHLAQVGLDPGTLNFSVHLEQLLVSHNSPKWRVFDELNYVGHHTLYDRVVKDMLARCRFWRNLCDGELEFEFICDDAAWVEDKDGGTDALTIERAAAEINDELPEDQRIEVRLEPCPKGGGSKIDRVRMVQELLFKDALIISALCPKTKAMLLGLPSEKVKKDKYEPDAGLTPQRCPHIHSFDSMSYPMRYYFLKGFTPKTGSQTEVFVCGQNGANFAPPNGS